MSKHLRIEMKPLVKLDGDVRWAEIRETDHRFRGFVTQLSPQRIEIVELLETKAPNPCIAQPYCCLVDTVIFYLKPYTVRPWHHIVNYRGRYELNSPSKGMHFEEWGRATHKLLWDSIFTWEGLQYETGGGQVFWKNKRWWMAHWARVREQAARTA